MNSSSDRLSPTHRLRESAGSMTINTPDDDTPIRELISTGERLFVVKDKAIYEVTLADQIDPERTNLNVPNTVQRVLSFGAEEAWVGAVVLTAHEFFLNSCFDPETGRKSFNLLLSVAQDIAGAKEILHKHIEKESEAKQSVDPAIGQDRSFVLPSVGNVEASCNEFLQRADHALRELFKTVQIFHPDVTKGGWESLKNKIDCGPQDLDNFSQFLAESIEFLKLVRNARNCVEHPRHEQRLIVLDFKLDKNNALAPPTVEIVHPKTPMGSASVTSFFTTIIESLVSTVELMVVFLCARSVKNMARFQVQVMELTPDQRKSAHVRFSYALQMGDKLVPLS